MSITAERRTALIGEYQAAGRRHRQPRSAGCPAFGAHHQPHGASEDACEGFPFAARSADAGRPPPPAAGLSEAQGFNRATRQLDRPAEAAPINGVWGLVPQPPAPSRPGGGLSMGCAVRAFQATWFSSGCPVQPLHAVRDACGTHPTEKGWFKYVQLFPQGARLGRPQARARNGQDGAPGRWRRARELWRHHYAVHGGRCEES